VVTAHRDGGSAHGARGLKRLSRHAERIELEPLTPSDVGQYLGMVAHRGAPRAELSEALYRATAGNPLFLLQTVRGLVARNGEDALGSLEPELIKTDVSTRDVLRAGFDVLDERVRRVLELASVLGEEFEVSTLRELSKIDIDALLDALEAAVDEGFLIAQPPSQFRFRHQLLRSTLYDGLTTADRVNVHRAAADILERSADARSRSGEIAHHNYRSLALGDYARVATAAERAARAAAHVHAFTDAVMFCSWALEALALDPDAQPRARAEVLLFCGRLEQLGGHVQDAQRTIEALVKIARQRGYADLLVRAARVLRPSHLMGLRPDTLVSAILEEALQSAPEGANDVRIRALSQLAWVPPCALDMQRSKELSARALSLARELDAAAPLLEALNARLYALSGPDDIAALLDVSDELLLRDRAQPTWVSVAALSARHAALMYRGDRSEAEAVQAALGRIAREHNWTDTLWSHDRISAQNRMLGGDFASAETAIAELRARAHRQRLSHGPALTGQMHAMLIAKRDGTAAVARSWDTSPPWVSIHDVMASVRPSLAWLCANGGAQRTSAKSVLETMVGDDGVKLPKEIGYLNATANLALLAIEFGDRARAERLYEELAPYPHHNTPNCLMHYEGSVSHFLGMLAAFLGRDERATVHFEGALDMNDRLSLQPQLAQTCYEYARLRLASTNAVARKSGRSLKIRASHLAAGLGMQWLVTHVQALD
jgi:phage terminase small subunit